MITVSGHSDDLIEIEGDLVEEFDGYGESCYIGTSNGALLRIHLDPEDGIWRIVPLAGFTLITVTPAGEVNPNVPPVEGDTDIATIEGDIVWVTCGPEFATTKGAATT